MGNVSRARLEANWLDRIRLKSTVRGRDVDNVEFIPERRMRFAGVLHCFPRAAVISSDHSNSFASMA